MAKQEKNSTKSRSSTTTEKRNSPAAGQSEAATRATTQDAAPTPTGYHLAPTTEAALLRIADQVGVKADALVDLAVRQWAATWGKRD